MKVSSSGEWFEDFFAGFAAYYLTSLPVLAGVFFAVSFEQSAVSGGDPVAACFRFDALHYRDIIRQGYSYDPNQGSLVAFFPAYPLLSRWIGQATRLSSEEAAMLAANLALLGAFVLLARYIRVRWPEATAASRACWSRITTVISMTPQVWNPASSIRTWTSKPSSSRCRTMLRRASTTRRCN
jgi:hypothetical protein